jgi:integrase
MTFHYRAYFPNSRRSNQFDAGGRRIHVGKLLEKQLEVYECLVANGTLSPSTLVGYRKAITNKKMQFWADVPLHSATPSKLRDWIAGLDMTAKAARNPLTPLRGVFEDALNDESIEFNPFERIALKKLLRQTSKGSDYEVDRSTAAEQHTLLAHARPDELQMLRFWFNTGLRPGKLMALWWPKIEDWLGGKVCIDSNLVARVVKGPKAQADIRDVELNDEALGALIAQNCARLLKQEHIWHNPRVAGPWETEETLWTRRCAPAPA